MIVSKLKQINHLISREKLEGINKKGMEKLVSSLLMPSSGKERITRNHSSRVRVTRLALKLTRGED